jgi:hypothetical protein
VEQSQKRFCSTFTLFRRTEQKQVSKNWASSEHDWSNIEGHLKMAEAGLPDDICIFTPKITIWGKS